MLNADEKDTGKRCLDVNKTNKTSQITPEIKRTVETKEERTLKIPHKNQEN